MTFEQAQERNRALYAEHRARHAAALSVSCPRCKAPVGIACEWGSTHSGGNVHTPRLRKHEATERRTV